MNFTVCFAMKVHNYKKKTILVSRNNLFLAGSCIKSKRYVLMIIEILKTVA